MKATSRWKDCWKYRRGKLAAIFHFIRREPELRHLLNTVHLLLIVLFVTRGF